MYSDKILEMCLKRVEDDNWNWFVTLRFCPMLDPQDGVERYDNSKDAITVWLKEIQREYVGRESLPHVCATEFRDQGEVNFHVLLKHVPENKRKYWKWRWKQLAPGFASDREIRETMGGLFRYFVYRLNCAIESVGGPGPLWEDLQKHQY
jgi:hypothetical protein